ncbi:MAG: HPt (histidine-containing phosphotransfer) domain-containing protein [Lentimonas sp.]|jgi:HPt (histidine-containing phosphotransfer) domain-containing protein
MSEALHIPGVNFDSSIPAMDRDQIDMLLMVDDHENYSTALVCELFGLFQGESADKLLSLDAVCAANDREELRGIVHFIAGSAGNLGLAYLSGFYRSIEQAIYLGTLTDLSQCSAPIRHAFTDACEAFSSEFGV